MKQSVKALISLALLIISPCAVLYAQMGGMGSSSTTSSGFTGYDGHDMQRNLILPQVAVGQHYTTSLLLLSMANTQMMSYLSTQDLTTTGTVYFYGQDGARLMVSINGAAPASQFSFSLGPAQSASYDIAATGGGDTSGWALVDIDEPLMGSGWGMMDGSTMSRGMRVMANVFYTYSGTDMPFSRVGVMPTMYEMGRFNTSIISAQNKTDLQTGVAIVNISSNAITANLRLVDINGNSVASTQLSLNPGSQTAKFINQLFPNISAGFQGFLQINSNGDGIVPMGLIVSHGVLTSVGMMHYGQISMMP
jgi:hypothetical protein